MSMENSMTVLGSKGLIKKHEFVRIIIQSLYSLGYRNSASCLESESGISLKSMDFESLKSQIFSGNWDGCIDTLNAIKDLMDETRASALFLICKQRLLECLNQGDDATSLAILQKEVSPLKLGKDKAQNLAQSIVTLKDLEFGQIDNNVVHKLQKKLLADLEKLIPPIILPERRLEHLVETAVMAQVDSSTNYNTFCSVSLYEDLSCDEVQIPAETVQILTEHKNEVWCVQFSNNGDYLASASKDCTAIIWKVLQDGRLMKQHTLRSHQKSVTFVAWSPDDTKLLTCGNKEFLKLWDVETGRWKHTFGDLGLYVNSCAWFPDSERLVCGSPEPEPGIYMWNFKGKVIKVWRGEGIFDLAVTPDGENIICIYNNKEIRILNLETDTMRVVTEECPMTSLSVSQDGKYFIVNNNLEIIHMWDVAGKWNTPLKYVGHKQRKYVIRSCFGGLNSTFIASGSEDTQIYIWHRQDSRPIEVLSGHSMAVNSVSWNPTRHQMLASASDDRTIRIWVPSSPSIPKNIQPDKLS